MALIIKKGRDRRIKEGRKGRVGKGREEGRDGGRKGGIYLFISHTHYTPTGIWKIRSQFPSQSSFTSLTLVTIAVTINEIFSLPNFGD